MHAPSWQPDLLGEGYRQHVLELGADPDGEGSVAAVLVRREPRADEVACGAVLYVHGFSDYFFQTALADFLAERGLAFYAIDLRKSGRARLGGQTAHYVSDLALCDEELDSALAIIAGEHPDVPVLIVAHSTGGLIVPLWLDRRRAAGRLAPVAGLVLNSPWFDLQGKAVRRGHARLHRGLDVGVPSLVLRSSRSHFSGDCSPLSDRADTVLDVRQIARWAGCLGAETTVTPIQDARHDVFLSLPGPREHAYAVLAGWLDQHLAGDTTARSA